jgi:hypothetical protein
MRAYFFLSREALCYTAVALPSLERTRSVQTRHGGPFAAMSRPNWPLAPQWAPFSQTGHTQGLWLQGTRWNSKQPTLDFLKKCLRSSEGAPNKVDAPPPSPPPGRSAISGTYLPTEFLFLIRFLVRAGAFFGKGRSKTHQPCFCKESMSKYFQKENDKFFNVSFSSVFCFIALLGVSHRWEFENTTKNRVEKLVQKNRPKKSKPIVFRFRLSRLRVFLGEWSSKHHFS